MRELRYAIRQLVRTPAFTVVAVLTLALGMGANTAFFSVLHGVMLQQPPYPAADRLVALHNVKDGRVDNGGMLSRAEVREYGERQRAFESIAAGDLGRMTPAAAGGGESFAERVKVSRVTPDLFATLGVGPVLGRTIAAADAQGQPVAVISYDFWQRHLGGREDALARRIRLNGIEYAIVGIMPAGFSYPESDMAHGCRSIWRRAIPPIAPITIWRRLAVFAPACAAPRRVAISSASPAISSAICPPPIPRRHEAASASTRCGSGSSAACSCRSAR